MKLYIKQKVFSWGDKFTVKDEAGRDRYYVEGEIFTFGRKLHVYDMSGREVAFIKQEVWSWMPRYYVFCGDRQVAEIKKEFTFLFPKYNSLSAATISFELGTGDVTISKLIAEKSADIEGGAGRITISNGAIKDLALKMGMGQLNLTAALTGDSELELGVGESNITLLGSKDDYELDIEKGIGNITVDGKNVADYGSSGNGTNKVEINGGVGSINVEFKESESK